MEKLTLSYRFDASYSDDTLPRDDFGSLAVRIETKQFSGHGSFWVQWQDVVELGEQLETFPITAENPVTRQWGYDTMTGDDVIIQLSIGPKNALGDLLVEAVIADQHAPSRRVSTSFRSGYPALEMFRRDIAAMMKMDKAEATLVGY